MTTETLTRSEAHRKLLTLGMPVEQVIHVLDYPNDLLDPIRPALTVAASEKAVAIVAAYQRHCESKATTDPLATVPAEERARMTEDELAMFAAYPAGHCVQRLAAEVRGLQAELAARPAPAADARLDAVFAKWLPLLAPYLNGEQQAALRADVVRAVDASQPRIPLPEAAARFTAGYVQRLRGGTWEWSPDGGFDQGVYTLSVEVGTWLTRTVNETVGASRQAPSLDRESLGRIVREVWIAWAYEQAAPKPSWLVPWEGLSECDREVDRRIGERIAHEALASQPGLTGAHARSGIYIASKAKHGTRWQALRASGVPIVSTWIDESGEGQTSDWGDLWARSVREASTASAFVMYVEPGETHRGSLVEIGAAILAGVPVFWVGPAVGSVRRARGVTICVTIEDAIGRAVGCSVHQDTMRDSDTRSLIRNSCGKSETGPVPASTIREKQ